MKIESFKSFVKTFALTRGIYCGWKYLKSYQIRKIRKNMKLKGKNTVLALEKILDSNVFYYMDMGTMLGIVREGKLLGHDLDIDVAVYAENEEEKVQLKLILLEAGCKLTYTYYADGIGVVEQSFELDGLKFDINYYSREGDRDICYLMYRDLQKTYDDDDSLDVVKLSVHSVKAVKRIPFAGEEVTVPEYPEVYLSERYGENWRIPDPNYKYWCGPSCEHTEYKGHRRKER